MGAPHTKPSAREAREMRYSWQCCATCIQVVVEVAHLWRGSLTLSSCANTGRNPEGTLVLIGGGRAGLAPWGKGSECVPHERAAPSFFLFLER